MPNFQPSSVINFTGSIAGSPAANVASNAVSGLTAFNDTVTFRDPVIPNGTLSVFSPNSGTATQDGNVVVNIDYTYTDGARVADYYIIFYKQGGGTVSPANPCIIVNPASGVNSSAKINVVPGSPYTFAFSSARVTKDGVRASSPQNQTARTMIAGNYTGNVNGTGASTVVTNASNGATAFSGTVNYRTDTAPSGSTVFGTISPSYTTDGNVVVNVPYTHSPGNLKTDFILVYYKEGGGTVVSSDPAVSTNPATGNLNFTLKPSTTYSFGVQNVRRTESGLLGSSITSSSNLALSAGNYTGNVNGTGASTVVTNASNGATAFSGTVNYRTDTAPSGSTVFGTISPSYTTDGNVVVNVPYTHSPGNLKSDFILVYYKEGGGTVVASDPAVSTNPDTGNLNFTLKPSTTYSFGVQNVRRTESGLVGSSITSSSNVALSAGNYTGSIKGISASAVVTGGDVGGNLIVRSEDLTTGWGLVNLTASPGLLYLDNATTFWKLSESTTTYGLHDAYSSKFNVSPGEVITVSAYVAAAERDIVDIGALYSPWSNAVASRYPQMKFNLTTGTLLQTIASPISDAGITQIGTLPGGQKVYRIYVTTVPANFTTTNGGGLYFRVCQSDASPQYSGVVGNGAYFTRLQASKNLLANYIKTTTTPIESTAKTTDAFNETIKYRQDVSPSSDPTGLAVTQTATADGNVVYKLSYSYSPGSIPADLLITYVKEGGGTISPSVTAFSTNAVTGDISFVLKPTTNYRFGVQAARRTESGFKGGNIISTVDISPSVTSNFTGNLDGSPASQVRSGTINYRTTGAPTNVPIPASIAVSPSANATRTIKLSWEKYTQGAKQADVIGIFYRKDGVIPTLLDSCIITNVNTSEAAYYEIDGLLPDSQYSFGIAAGRRTENGIEFGIINTVYGTSPYYVFDNDVIQEPDLRNINYSVIPSPTSFYTPDQVLAYTIYDTNNTQFQNINYQKARQTTASPSTWFAEAYIKKQATATSPYFGMMRVDGLKATGSPLLGYNEIRFRYDDADFQPGAIISDGVSPGFAYKEEITTADGSVWYRVGVATNFPSTLVSPRVFLYPALGTTTGPGNYTYDVASTGTAVVADLTLRKAIKTVNFDWTNISPASVNFTGNLDGSPATKIRTQTANYRQDVSPTNDPSISPNNQSATADGNVVARISYGYSQGAIPADFILVYVKENGGTISPSVQSYTTNPVSGDMSFVLKPSTTYRFGVQAVRRTETGIKGGNIISSSDIVLTSPNYTGLIAGVPSNTVTTVVSNFNSSNDRNGISPTAPTLTNTIADYSPIILNSDGTCDIKFNWSYTNGSPLAANNVDGFIVYVQSFNYPNNYTFTGSETSAVIPVANASSYGYTFKNLPAHQWHDMAVRAYRVVDSDIASPSTLYSDFNSSTYNNSRGITSTAQFPVGQKSHTVSSSPIWDNLFTTDDYTNVYWSKQNINAVVSSTELAPDGRTFAYELQETVGSPNHQLFRALTPVQGKYFVFKFFVKRKGTNKGVSVRYGAAGFGAIRSWQFEISPLSMTFPAGGAGHGAIRPLQNNWYEIFTAYPVTVTSPNSSNIQLMITSDGTVAYEGVPSNGLYVANLAAYHVDSINGVSPGLPSIMDVVGSTWYDTPNKSLKIWNGSRWIENSTVGATYGTSPSNLTGLSGDGINRIPIRYSGGFSAVEGDANITNRNKFPIWLTSPARSTGVELFSVTALSSPDNPLGPTSGYYGSHAVKVKFNGNTTGREVYFASSPAAYNIELVPNSKWIVSGKGWLSSPSTTPFTAQLGLLTATSPTTGYRISSTISTRQTWVDLSGTLNLINDSSTLGTLIAGATGGGGAGGSPYLWLDGLMLERKVGPGSTPTPWSKGSQYGKLGTNKGAPILPPSNISVGSLLNGMTLNQGDGNSRPVLGGFYVGSARDADNIIFPTPYATIPTVVFFPGAQTTGSPFANVPNVSTICEAQNLTTTGFTARIRFIGQATGVSPITDIVNFGAGSPSVLSPGSPDSAGYTGAPSPAFAINKTNGSEAFDDKYKYTFNVTVYNNFVASGEPYEPGSMDVGLYARKAAGWYLASTQNIRGGTAGPTTTKSVSPTVTIDGVIYSPASGQAEFAIANLTSTAGTINSFASVSYSVANPPTDVSATASGTTASYAVPFAVIATSGSS